MNHDNENMKTKESIPIILNDKLNKNNDKDFLTYSSDFIDNHEKILLSNNLADLIMNIMGQNPNASLRPISSAGVVYEFDRGVIGIGIDGKVEKEILDGTENHHWVATIRVAALLGVKIPFTDLLFVAGSNAADRGIIIIQLEGDNAVIYLPNAISLHQKEALLDALTPRENFNFACKYNTDVLENQNLGSIIAIVNNSLDEDRSSGTR